MMFLDRKLLFVVCPILVSSLLQNLMLFIVLVSKDVASSDKTKCMINSECLSSCSSTEGSWTKNPYILDILKCNVSIDKNITYMWVLSHIALHGNTFPLQHYVIKFVNNLLQIDGFSGGAPVYSFNKIDFHDITEIVLKVALSTTTLPSLSDKEIKR